MGKANDVKQRLKEGKRATQAIVGEPLLKWQKCSRQINIFYGARAYITKEQSMRLDEVRNA